MKSKNTKNATIILHNIRSAYNVGSIFRTADAVGISKIYITGYTPAPVDQFGRKRRDISKSALGAEETISWGQASRIGGFLERLKKQGVYIIAIEQSTHSIDYKKIKIQFPVVFLLGNEVRGLSKSILQKCDVIVEIPMKGKKESLNVSVAAGIVLFRALGV